MFTGKFFSDVLQSFLVLSYVDRRRMRSDNEKIPNNHVRLSDT